MIAGRGARCAGRALSAVLTLAAAKAQQSVPAADDTPALAIRGARFDRMADAYLRPDRPVFVTADSALWAFAAALERSALTVTRIQEQLASSLLGALATHANGSRRLRLVAATGLVLQGEPIAPLVPASLETAARRAAREIAASSAVVVVDGLDAPIDARGIAELPAGIGRRYLERIGFRSDSPRDRELLTEFSELLRESPELRRLRELLLAPNRVFGGRPVARTIGWSLDALGSEPHGPTVRVLSPLVTRDADLLMRAEFLREQHGNDDLSYVWLAAAGPLASRVGRSFAPAWLVDAEPDPAPRRREGLADRAIEALGLLLAPRPRSVPGVFRTRAWSLKQLNTQLGGLARLRIAVRSHVTSAAAAGYAPRSAYRGTVTPYPEFFARLAELADTAANELESWLDEAIPARWIDDARNRLIEVAANGFRPEHRLARLAAAREHDRLGPGWVRRLRRRSEPIELTRSERRAVVAFGLGDVLPDTDLRDVADLCRRLASIAGLSARGELPNPDDGAWLAAYGRRLERLDPRPHPAGRGVFVFRANDGSRGLQVGNAALDALEIVLPVDGRPVRHHGAVASFREAAETRPVADWNAIPRPAFTRTTGAPWNH